MFCVKGVLRNFTKFRGKHLCQSLFFNKITSLRPEACNFINKETLVQVLSCEFCETSKNTFSNRTPLVAASRSITWINPCKLRITEKTSTESHKTLRIYNSDGIFWWHVFYFHKSYYQFHSLTCFYLTNFNKCFLCTKNSRDRSRAWLAGPGGRIIFGPILLFTTSWKIPEKRFKRKRFLKSAIRLRTKWWRAYLWRHIRVGYLFPGLPQVFV